MTRLFVHIDRLAIDGAAPSERRAIEAAVKAAIRRELGRPGAADAVVAAGSRRAVDAGSVPRGTGHAAVGAAIGRSLTRGEPQ